MKTPGPAVPRSDAVPGEAVLHGYVERVTYRNEENGFCVIRVKARGHRELVALVGTIAEINPGEWLEAEGEWVRDPRHGPQFKATTVRLTQPDTVEGIEKYLGSGMIHGIGPIYAKKLVQKFGRDVFTIIEKFSARLREVPGIGPQRRDAIKNAWAEHKHIREIMAFLFSHGASTARALRIYKTYGDRAMERIRLDPYCLARDVRGIGFKTADAMAEKMGIARDSDLRARAGALFTLQEAADEGHCALPRPLLVERAADQLGLPSDQLERAVEHELAEARMVQRIPTGGGPHLLLAELDDAEGDLARQIQRLNRGAAPLGEVDAARATAWVEDQVRMTLDPIQRDAIGAALKHKMMILTGGPGVGKTTLVQAIVHIFRAKKLRVLLCAPTGRAAKRLSESTRLVAKTIHRLLIYEPETHSFRHNASRPIEGDLFVIDESSMLDVVLASQLLRAIPSRAAVLWVGDVDQLPSVGPGAVLADLLDSGEVPAVRLTKVFRQAAQSHIITNAHRINEGIVPPLDAPEPGAASDFYFVEAEDPARLTDQLVRMVREAIPRKFGFHPVDDIQVLTPMQRGELGARALNTRLQQELNPNGRAVERLGMVFREGDKVMQMENDYDKDVFNGDIGRIAAVHDSTQEIHVRFEDRIIRYSYHELDELALCYATTIHKSQGSEYPCVIVPIHTQHFVMLQRNLIYTAVTRGRKLVVLVGTKKAVAMAVRRADSARRVTCLQARLRGELDLPG
ncbi:MAG: ATP-dependent RecD-like DNA helicase [Kiritimatiellae bacterium]|nr:ATP-dependent RecD-like DNA helicase [Kiritimatiellia bacterium]